MPELPSDVEAVPTSLFSVLATVALAIVPPALLAYASPSVWNYFGLGVASWSAALVTKHLLISVPAVRRLAHRGWSGAALWGAVSAISELGFTAIMISEWGKRAMMIDVIAIGVGVASAEIFYVFGVAVREHIRGQSPDDIQAWIVGARQSLLVRNMLFIERLAAELGHIGSRGLLYLAVREQSVSLGAVAVVLFTIVDGVAVYGRARKWNWCDPAIARRFYSACFAIAIIENVLFLSLARIGHE